jgi:hypothetical protein
VATKPLQKPGVPTYPWPGAAGWLALNATWIGYDLWATKVQRLLRRPEKPTMSMTIGHYLAHPVMGPLIAGAGLGMVYHLLIEELLPAWYQQMQARAAITP